MGRTGRRRQDLAKEEQVSTYAERVKGPQRVETRSAEEIWSESEMHKKGWGLCFAPECGVWYQGRNAVIVRRKHPSGDPQRDAWAAYCSEECAKLATTVERVATKEVTE